MPVKFGRAKDLSKIGLDDHLKHPFWLYAHDERHDEEFWKPVVSPRSVTRDVLSKDHPVITLRVADSETYGIGSYDHTHGVLHNIALWKSGRWTDIEKVRGLKFPVRLIAIPAILRQNDIVFGLRRRDYRAKRLKGSSRST